MAHHVRVTWDHEFADEPVELFSELGDDRYEVRKVEEHTDGRLDWADADREMGTIGPGEVPMPELDEINAQPEFHATAITRDEFEAIWERARNPGGLAAR